MVRTGNVDFSCKRLTSIEIRKSKYRIIRRVRFQWDPPPPDPEKDIWIRACHTSLTYNDPHRKGPLIILWEKEKMLVTSIFSVAHNFIQLF